MTELRFYHLTKRTLEQTLPGLLEKSLERGWHCVVMTASEERAEALNQYLWTFKPDSFLPHGMSKDGHPDHQPILITCQDERPNAAHVLFITDGATSARLGEFELVCDLFDGNDPDAVGAARDRWRLAKAEGHDLTYWQQNERGGWEKKA